MRLTGVESMSFKLAASCGDAGTAGRVVFPMLMAAMLPKWLAKGRALPPDERRRFRAILHNCRVHGLESQTRGNPKFKSWLRGYASYIHMVHPEEGAEFLEAVESLLGPEPEQTEGA